jgi:ATP-dependent exoDNAse (exonuclease V) beta subunit
MTISEKPFVVYKSSAGSGKTFTLTKSYLTIILSAKSDDYFKTILAITFTNKAAAEMKNRILNSLREFALGNFKGSYLNLAESLCDDLKISFDDLKQKSKKVYSLMLHRYSDINISTIDKFVHKIVRTFAHDLNLPINFEVNLEEGLLLAEAVYKLLENAEENEDLFNLLVRLAETKTDDDKSWNIEMDLIKYAQDLTKEQNVDFLSTISPFSIKDIDGKRIKINKQIEDLQDQLKSIAYRAVDLIINSNLSNSDFYFGTKGIGSWFERVYNLSLDTLENPNSYVLKAINDDVWYTDKTSFNTKEKIDSIKVKLNEIYNELMLFSADRLQVLKVLSSVSANLFRVAVLNEIESFFKVIRKEENVVTISEFNKRINQIVNEEPAPYIYERLGEKYHHYLIDEFQDTSLLQFQNFLPLIDNALAEQYSCMLVGDSKQAIYRWRGGAVEQMDTLPDLINSSVNPLLKEREASLKRNFELKILENNFRSKREIVEFNNNFFEWAKNSLTEDLRKIYNAHSQKVKSDNVGGYVKINVLNSADKLELTQSHLAQLKSEIDELFEKGVHFSQMAIITRGNAELIEVSEFLMAHHIPVLSSESLLLKNDTKIKFIEAYLNWLSVPESKLYMFEWLLLANQFKIISDDLFRLFLNASNENYVRYKKDLINDFLISDGLYNFSIFELVEFIINKYLKNFNGFDAYLISFLDCIHDFNISNSGSGLITFLNWWSEKKNKLSLSVPSGNQAIQLLTIHKSKGLEFPYVLMPFADWEIRRQDESKWVENKLTQIDLPVFILDLKESLENTVYESVYLEEVSKSLLDNINLLYVAFTRAEYGLIIITTKRSKETKDVAWIINNYLNSCSKNIPFTVGEIMLPPHKHDQVVSSGLHYFSRKGWRDKINVKAGGENDEINLSEELILGKAFHHAVEFFIRTKDMNKTSLYLQSMGYSQNVISIALLRFNDLLQNKLINYWLNSKTIICVEQDIISDDGNVLRPDLVLQVEDSMVIIDFKTGDQLEKHINQVEGYKNLFQKMGYSKIEAYLLYVNPLSLIKV